MGKISVIACPAPSCGDVLMVFLMSIINRTQVYNYHGIEIELCLRNAFDIVF